MILKWHFNLNPAAMKHPLKIPAILLLLSGIIFCYSCEKEVPTVTTADVSNPTTTSAISGGEVTDNGGAEVTTRGVCWDITPNPTVSSNEQSDGNKGNGIFTIEITGLTTNTTYYVRAYAINKVGLGYGNQVSFNTLCQPASPTTDEPSDLGTNSLTLRGKVNANGSSTTVSFDYGLTTTYDKTVTAAQSPVTGNNETPVSARITGLAEGVTYHYRVKTVNCGGTTYGSDKIATTLVAIPIAPSNLTVNAVSSSQINLSWADNSNNETGFKIERSLNNSSYTEIATVNSNVTLYQNNSLAAGTTYYYRIRAYNIAGNSTYSIVDEATTFTVPTLSTGLVSVIDCHSISVTANITNDGGSPITGKGFCWSTTVNPTISNSYTNIGTGSGSFTGSITGLTANASYHLRSWATNSVGISYGNDVPFATPPCPITNVTVTSFTLSPTSVSRGGRITYQGVISASFDVSSCSVGIYLSTDNSWGSNDALLTSITATFDPKLGTYTTSGNFTVPTTVPTGAIYIFCIADNTKRITESNELDNIKSARITIL